MKSELTTRQWALYHYLRDMNDTWTTQYNAVKALNMLDGFYEKPDINNFHDSAARQQMTADIRAINDSAVIQKIIISSKNGIKLANKEEFETYIEKEISAALRRLIRARRKARKGSLDNQFRIPLGKYERDYIQAYINSDRGNND